MSKRSDDVVLALTRRDLRMLLLGSLLATAVIVPFWLRAAAPELTTFENGEVADANLINANFQALATAVTSEGKTFNEIYEEGTWTPTFVSTGAASTVSYTKRKG